VHAGQVAEAHLPQIAAEQRSCSHHLEQAGQQLDRGGENRSSSISATARCAFARPGA
jgi:hypothetical protein